MQRRKHRRIRLLKNKRIVLPLCLLLVLGLAAGATLAFIQMATNTVENTFTPAKVEIEIHEDKTATEKKNIQLENLVTENAVPVYVRATLAIYWQDTIDETLQIVAPPAGGAVEVGGLLSNGWFKDGNGIYYYANVLQPGEKTTVMLDEIKVTLPEDSTAQCVIDVHAEAIQAEPVSAVEGAWGVKVIDGLLYQNGSA